MAEKILLALSLSAALSIAIPSGVQHRAAREVTEENFTVEGAKFGHFGHSGYGYGGYHQGHADLHHGDHHVPSLIELPSQHET